MNVEQLTDDRRVFRKAKQEGVSSRTVTCSECHETFVGRLHQKYCSKKCRDRAYIHRRGATPRLKEDAPKQCAHCCGVFMTNNPRRIYCCDSCSVLAARKRAALAVKMFADLHSMSLDKAQEVQDFAGAGWINKQLTEYGMSYDIHSRQWL